MNPSYLTRRTALRHHLRSRALPCLAAVVLLAAAASAFAYGNPPAPLRATGAAAPMANVRPGAWSAAGSYVINNTDSDADVLDVLGFDMNPNIQFARHAWLPPHSVLHTWIPFHGPAFEPRPHTVLKTETKLLDAQSSSTEHDLTVEPGLMLGQSDRHDNVGHGSVVALLSSHDDTDMMVVAARNSIESANRPGIGNTSYVIATSPDRFSPCPQTLGEFDALALGDQIGQLDLAQLENIRQWALAGGTLWIIGGEVSDEQLQMLLGYAWTARVIDTTELQDFKVVGEGRSSDILHSDDPVSLVRIAPGENMTVLDRVDNYRGVPRLAEILAFGIPPLLEHFDGYPAAVEFPFGAGRVFVTTLAPAGWARSQKAPTKTLQKLAETMFVPPDATPTVEAPIEAGLAELAPAQVGSRIVPRSLVLIVMSGFCAAFVLAGAVLLRYRKMEWFAAVGVLLAAGASATLLAEASLVNQSAPLTVASAGIAQVFPDQPAERQQVAVAVYNPGPASVGPVSSQTGGLFWPTRGLAVGGLTRLVFTDRDRWQWQNLNVAPGAAGMLRGEYVQSADLAEPVSALLRLTADSAEPALQSGPLGPLDDQLLAGPNGAMLLRANPDGTFAAAESDRVHNNQYIFGSVLTDTQRQHQEIYRQLFAKITPIAEPTLLGFNRGGPGFSGLSVPLDPRRRDTELLCVPMQFAPPPAGSSLTIPSAFIPYQPMTLFKHEGALPYALHERKWNEISDGRLTRQFLQFSLPRSLLPLKLSTLTFDLTLQAPGRDVSLIKLKGNTPVNLVTVHGPLETVEAKMTGADCPLVDPQGNIKLGFTVGVPDSPDLKWQISDVRIAVSGEKMPRTQSDAPAIREQTSAATADESNTR